MKHDNYISFTVKLADIPITIHALYKESRAFLSDYLTDAEPLFSVTMYPEDISAEQNYANQTAAAEDRTPCTYPAPYLETLALYRKLAECLLNYNILLFHGSAISVDQEVYIFTAKSGTGKSTHARLWRNLFGDRAFMVNDDKPLLKIQGNQILACGTPWDGKHHLSRNISLPVKAICVLHRDSTNHIFPLTAEEAFADLYVQSFRPGAPEHLMKVLNMLDTISSTVPLYSLGCNMDPEAAVIAYNGMQ